MWALERKALGPFGVIAIMGRSKLHFKISWIIIVFALISVMDDFSGQ